MKKLLLVPVLLLSMLTGCNSKEGDNLPVIDLTSWLSDMDFAKGHFFNSDLVLKDYGMMPDYNFVIADCIKENTKDIEGKKVKECNSNALLTYYVTQEHYPFDFCAIYVHEDRIETSAITPYTYNKDKVFQQFYSYKIGAATAAEIVGRAYQRVVEIGDIHVDEREEARIKASPANYFDTVKKSENGAKITVYGSDVTKDVVIQDSNKLFADDLKSLEYTATTESIQPYMNKKLLAYILSDDLYVIYYDTGSTTSTADFEITFDSSLGYKKTLSFKYTVNKEKLQTIIKKMKGEK